MIYLMREIRKRLTSGNLLCLRSSTRNCRRFARVSGRETNTFSDKLSTVKLKEKKRLFIRCFKSLLLGQPTHFVRQPISCGRVESRLE